MTTWAMGDTVTSTWLNSVEKVLAMGTFSAATTPRLVMAPNTTYDISGAVATNMSLNGSITITGPSKYYEWMGVRSLSSNVSTTGGDTSLPYATCFGWQHTAVIGTGCGAYGGVGALTAVSGAGKASGWYSRVGAAATFTGTVVAGTFAITMDTGHTPAALSSVMTVGFDSGNVSGITLPFGIAFSSNNNGSKIGTGIFFDSTHQMVTSCMQWNLRATGNGDFIRILDSNGHYPIKINSDGNIYFGDDATHFIACNAISRIIMPINGDVLIGKSGAATADTTGHMYIQAVAGAPTGVPGGNAGYVAMRYDSTNNKIYVYNGGWKATAALA